MMKKGMSILSIALCAGLLCACTEDDDATLKIDAGYREIEMSAEGGSVDIPVRASGTFTAASSGEWCHAEVVPPLLRLRVDPMEEASTRSARVTVSLKGCPDINIDVRQISVLLNNPPSEFRLSNMLRTFSVSVTSNTQLNFSYPDWVTPVDGDWEPGTKVYVFEASQMDGDGESREGSFTVATADGLFSRTIPVVQTSYATLAMQTLGRLWAEDMFASSPLSPESERYRLLSTLESYCNALGPADFKSYLSKSDAAAEQMEMTSDILSCYRLAFDRVFSDIQSTVVERGTVVIWHLYNMGFIVKTPSVCFGMDINHRYASRLAPYLDFITVSHSDTDHIDTPLMAAMEGLGKPVLTNFRMGPYQATAPTVYNIGDIRITTSITDENATDLHCTTIHRIRCGEDAGNFEIIHTGDSSYDKSQFTECLDGSRTNLLILRYGNTAETKILGSGSGQVQPDYVFFSHLEELRHNIGSSPARATILGAVGNMSRFAGTVAKGKVYMPFWGEKVIWKDGTLSRAE